MSAKEKNPKDKDFKMKEKKGGKSYEKFSFKSHGSNPISDYTRNPQLAKIASNISTAVTRGTRIDFTSISELLNDPATSRLTLSKAIKQSSVFQLVIDATGANGHKANDPINIGMTDMYAWIRHANSGSRNYESSDLYMYCDSLRELWGFAAWVRRLINTSAYVDPWDKNLPRDLFKAQFSHIMREILGEYQYQDLDTAYGQFAGSVVQLDTWLASFINRLSIFAIPRSFIPVEKAIWYYSFIYVDEDIKTNLKNYYVFTPTVFSRFEAVASTTGGAVIPCTKPGDSTNLVDRIIEYGEYLLSGFMYQEDSGIISGDIRKAYDLSELLQVAPSVGERKEVLSNDYLTLMRIHNASITPTTMGIYNRMLMDKDTYVPVDVLDLHDRLRLEENILKNTYARYQKDNIIYGITGIAQNADILLCDNPEDAEVAFPIYTGHVLDFHKAEVPNEEIIEGTRLTTAPFIENEDGYIELPGSGSTQEKLLAYHSDFFVLTYVGVYRTVSSQEFSELTTLNQCVPTSSTGSYMQDSFNGFYETYSPRGVFILGGPDRLRISALSTRAYTPIYLWQVHNIVPTSRVFIKNLHNVCVLSQLNVPNTKYTR